MGNYLIAGATSGIGKGCVKRLIENGHNVVAIGRNDDKLNLLAEQFSERIYTVKYDMSNLTEIRGIYEICKTKNIIFDGLIYSVGVDSMCPIKANSIEKTRYIMDVNCFAFAEMGRLFYNKRHSNDNSSIVAISSIASLTNEIGMMSYSASKAALNSVVKTMAKEFVSRRIRVNAILPGGVDTPMARNKNELLQKSDEDVIKEQRFGLIPVEQIVNEIEFLLSEHAGYMTGELITMSGGVRY